MKNYTIIKKLQYTALILIMHNCIYAQSTLAFHEAFAYLADSAIHMTHTDTASKKAPVSMSKLDEVLYYAESYLGTPYRYGGTTEAGLDCSGFMNKVFGWLDKKIPRSSREIATLGISIPWNEIEKGDLLYFSRSSKSDHIGHIAMVIEVGDKKMKIIHASTTRGVVIENIYGMDYYLRRFVMAKRIFF
jgi:probable lipoprotein NlpC